MRFQGNMKIAVITAVGVLLLAAIAGAVVFGLTLVQSTTEDTPAEIVGETAGAAVGPVQTMGAVASGPLDAEPASADESSDYEYTVSVSGSRDEFTVAASWDAVVDATSYDVELLKQTATGGTTVEQTTTGVTATTASFKLSSAASFRDSHVVKVTPNGAPAFGPGESAVIAPPAAPALTTSVSGTRSADGKQLTVSWDEVTGADSYSLNYYVHDGNDKWFRYTDDIVGTSFTMKNLQPKKSYTAAIMSVNTYRDGDLFVRHGHGWANSNETYAPPSAPTSVGHEWQSAANRLVLVIKWTEPDFTGTGPNGSSSDLRYSVYCRTSSTASWVRVINRTSKPVSGNPKRHETWSTNDNCLPFTGQVAITAINYFEGVKSGAHTLSLQ